MVAFDYYWFIAMRPPPRCTGEQYLDYLGIEYSAWGLWENQVALAVMMLIFLIIAYLKLKYIKKFT